MNATTKVKSKDLAPNLTCHICKGYFIEATTIVECLHSFCKSCIVKHLEKSEYCPKCDVQLHTTKPLSSIRSDQMLQEIVYKLVPGLFQNEMQRRRKFYEEHSETKPTCQMDSGHVHESYITSDDIINLTLEYYTTDVDFRESTKRFIKCPAAVSISILKKLIQGKYDLTNDATIEVMYGERILPDDFLLMDIAYKYSWTQNGKPLQLCYRVKGPASIFKTVIPKKSLTLPSSYTKGSLIDKVSTATTTMSPKMLKNSTGNDATKKKDKASTLKKHYETNGTSMIRPINIIVNNNEETPPILNGSISKSSKSKGENLLPIKNRKKSRNLDMNGESPNKNKNKNKIKDPNRTKSKQPICRDFATSTTTTTTPTTSSTNTTYTNINNNNYEIKEKEVQLRISENGVICARNVVSGEEKIIHGTTNGPSSIMTSSSSSSTTCPTTIVTPTNISTFTAAAATALKPLTYSNGIHSSTKNHTYLVGIQGSNNNSTGKNNSNMDTNTFPILTNKSLNNSLHYPVQLSIPIPLQSQYHGSSSTNNNNNSVNVSNTPNLNINGKNNNATMKPSSLTPTTTTTNAKSKNLSLSRKRPMKTNTFLSEKVDKTKLKVPTPKRKLLGSNGNNNTSGNSNMETLKSVTKRLKGDLSTQNGINYFSAEITPIVNPTLLNHKTTTFSPSNNEVGNSINNNNNNNNSKRPITNNNQVVTPNTPFINGISDGKFTPTKLPQSTNNLSSSPLSNSKIFSQGTNKSPSCSPKKPKFFKSRHAVDSSSSSSNSITPTPTTNIKYNSNSYFGDLILNGPSSKTHENIIISAHSNTTTTTSTLPSYVNVSTNMSMNSNATMTSSTTATTTTPTASIGSTTTASTIRYPYSAIEFSNGVPLQTHVPILTQFSQFQNSPKHNIHNNNNIMFTNAYMNFAQFAPQLSIINNSPHNNNNNNNSNNNNTSLDLSLSSNTKMSSSPLSNTIQSNGNNFFIMAHQQQQQQQQKYESTKSLSDVAPKLNTFSLETNNKQKITTTNSSSGIGTITPSKSTDSSSSLINSTKSLLNVTPQQQHLKGYHNLGLGVNTSIVTKNPRKSSSPAKIGRQNINSLNLPSIAVKTLSTPEKSIQPKPTDTNSPPINNKNDSSCIKNGIQLVTKINDSNQVPNNGAENDKQMDQTENNNHSPVSSSDVCLVFPVGSSSPPTSSSGSSSCSKQENESCKDTSNTLINTTNSTVTENLKSTDDEGILKVNGSSNNDTNNDTNNTKGQVENSISSDTTKNIEQAQSAMVDTASTSDEQKTNFNDKTFNNNNNDNDMNLKNNAPVLENNNNSNNNNNDNKVPETTTC